MSVSSVVYHRKCMSCGACCNVCSKNAISFEYNSRKGFYYPNVNRSLCSNCGLCEKVCPALNQADTSIVGNYSKLLLGHSTNEFVRQFATSGGVINSLVRFIITENIVEAVIMVGKCYDSPVESDIILVSRDNLSELLNNPRNFSSRYVTVPVLKQIKEYKSKKLAVVGTPCQIKALSLMENRGFNNILLRIGITCSGGMSYLATDEYKRKQIKNRDAEMYYRGDGWPGKNTLIDGEKIVEYRHLGSLFERMFSSQIFKSPGCRECKDHFAEMADISFCDFWDQDELSKEELGNSVIIVRSHIGEKIIELMKEKNYIDIQDEISENDLINTQLKVLKVKKGNIRNSLLYRAFIHFCDLVFYCKIYKCFGLKIYKKLSNLYSWICNKAHFHT